MPHVISPLDITRDINGVNLATGRIEIDLPVLSVPAAPNLRFDRVQNAAAYVEGTAEGMGAEGPIHVNFTVHTGTGAAEAFGCPDGGTCTSSTGSGSRFAGSSFQQAGSGVRWTFGKIIRNTADRLGSLRYVSSVTFPNGERLTYTYDDPTPTDGEPDIRPTRITSSLGYSIRLHYQSNTVGTPAWSTVRQAALYRDGAPSTLLRRFTYTATTITDHANNPDDEPGALSYGCTGCTNAMAARSEVFEGSMTLPQETTATLRVESDSDKAVSRVIRDDVVWTYSYDRLEPVRENATRYYFSTLTVTGPENYSQTYTFTNAEERNILRSVRDSLGRTTTFDLEAGTGRPIRVVQPGGIAVNVAYDQYGNVQSRTTTPRVVNGVTAQPVTESGTYHPAGVTDCVQSLGTPLPCYRLHAYTDALDRVTNYAYNEHGQMEQRLDPVDRQNVRRRTDLSYLPVSLESSTTPISRLQTVTICGTGATCDTTSEIRTDFEYLDPRHPLLPTRENRRWEGTTLATGYLYDDSGRVTRVDGPLIGLGDATYSVYDAYGRRTWEIGRMGANQLRVARRHTYRNSDGRITRTETGTVADPVNPVLTVLNWVDYTYDSRRNREREFVRATTSSGTTRTYSVVQRKFDLRNRLDCEARRMNPDQFASSLLPASACQVDTRSDDYGNDRIAHFTYDAMDRVLREYRGWDTALQQRYVSYSYTASGQRASVTDANGNLATMEYDGFDRLSRWTFPSRTTAGTVNANDYESYRYDDTGNRVWLRKRDGLTIDYQYDQLDRMIAKLVPDDRAVAGNPLPDLDGEHSRDVFYDYNVLDLMTAARFDSRSGQGIVNVYDGFGRMTRSTINLDGVSRALSHRYDAGGRRTLITHPNGQDYTYAYDDASRLTGLYEGDGTTAPLHRFTYTPLGQVDVRTEAGGAGVDHAYDALGRLTGMAHNFAGGAGNISYSYGYNPASQIVGVTRSNDQYAWTGGEPVNRGYDPNGLNQYDRTLTSSGATATTFSYDANGNLTRSSNSHGVSDFTYDVENRLVGAARDNVPTATLRYDPLGRLYEVEGPSSARRFLWDGDALVAEYTDTGALAARFVHGPAPGVDDPLVWYGGGENRRLHTDHQGSVVAITYGNGAIRWINGYDAWGIPNMTAGVAANTGRFQYTGQIWITELGAYHYKARIYSPSLGRFLQTDPVGYDDQINLYAYVGNDPVNGTDSTGTRRDCVLEIRGGCEGSRPGVLDQFEPKQRPNPRRNRPARRDPTGGDAHLTLEEANNHYREGNGAPVDVDASRLTVILSRVPTRVGQTVESRVAGSDFRVHGSVNVTLQRDRTYRMVDGEYNFDLSLRRDPIRNIGTMIGRLYAGDGQSFMIRYHGSPRVVLPPPPDPYPCPRC